MSSYNNNSSDFNNDFGMIIGLFMIGAFLVVVYLIVIAMIWITAITITAGATVGGGVSLYNYGVAFKNNVKLEKPIR